MTNLINLVKDSGHSHSDNGHTHYEDSSGDGHYPYVLNSLYKEEEKERAN